MTLQRFQLQSILLTIGIAIYGIAGCGDKDHGHEPPADHSSTDDSTVSVSKHPLTR